MKNIRLRRRAITYYDFFYWVHKGQILDLATWWIDYSELEKEQRTKEFKVIFCKITTVIDRFESNISAGLLIELIHSDVMRVNLLWDLSLIMVLFLKNH